MLSNVGAHAKRGPRPSPPPSGRWVNIWWENEGARRVNWFMGLDLLQTVDLNIPPNETRDLHYAFTPSSTVPLINFFGHRHTWTPSFSSWIERKDGRVELIYQSFSWTDMPTFRYVRGRRCDGQVTSWGPA